MSGLSLRPCRMTSGEVLPGVVDDLVGADRADQAGFRRRRLERSPASHHAPPPSRGQPWRGRLGSHGYLLFGHGMNHAFRFSATLRLQTPSSHVPLPPGTGRRRLLALL
jgi:hypothetical protein